MDEHRNRDEIDLVEILLKTISLLRANFWSIVLFFLLGSGLGVTYFLTSRKVYESKMMVSSVILTDAYSKILFESTNRHINEGNSAVLSAQFNISETAARAIVSINIENFIESATPTALERNKYLITAEVTDQDIFPDLQAGIVRYLENNEYAKVRTEQNRIYMQQMLASAEKEIADLKDFKERIFNGDFFQSNKGNVMFDPTEINSKIIELTEKKIVYQNNLQISNGVHVIEGFNKFQRPSKPKLSMSLLAGSVVGLIFVGALIIFKSTRKLLEMAGKES